MAHAPASLDDWARGAQIFAGMGTFHRKITTSSPQAQEYFDQGMRFMWAFNHDESSRSFAKAAQLDPRCAMCLWGLALTVGPNYNMPMMAESRAKVAYDSLQRASELLDEATEEERALINALRARYPNAAALDPTTQGPVLTAYAAAMKEVAHRFPKDSDIQTMYAESLMNINAWKLYSLDGKPAPGTEEIVATLESVLRSDPSHPGANHYYVHAMEASPHPEKAVQAAERLRGMMPAAGHLEHMPAHIMQRIGRYEDAAEANRKGAAADNAYLGQTKPPDYYTMYLAHNYQFLAYSASMEGRRAETLEAMKQLRSVLPDEMMQAMPGTDWYGAQRYLALVRFQLWEDILGEPRPNPSLQGLTGGYLFARATALAATGRVTEAQQAQRELDELRSRIPSDSPAGFNSTRDVLELASKVSQSRLAAAQNDRNAAIASLTQAVALEDRLAYNEPADWFFPVRHLLGEQLLKAGRNAEAQAVYQEDLRRNPDNGWALFGLSQALRGQKKTAEAAAADARFREAWKHADTTLAAANL